MINLIECSPRKIKRITTESSEQKEDKNKEIYDFYRLLIYPSILRLKNEKDKINCSLWLTRIDVENSDLKLHLIKILFISLQNNRNFHLFLIPPPEDLSELNLFNEDNTMEMVKKIQTLTNSFYANEKILQEIEHKRSAAVATDMCSYSSVKTSKYMVQSFYVRSDFPIQMWYNPSDIVLPHTFDHNEWELYLNRFEIRTKSKEDDDDKHTNTCESIIKTEQVSKEIDTACIFRWHPHSILYNKDRPKRLAAFVEIDSDVPNQPFSQQQIDESAFNIVHKKSFPGYKILNPRIYSTVLMPDPTFVFNTTGVKIIFNKISHGPSAKRENPSADADEEERRRVQTTTTRTCCSAAGQRQNIVSEDVRTNGDRTCTTTTKTRNGNVQQESCNAPPPDPRDERCDDGKCENDYRRFAGERNRNCGRERSVSSECETESVIGRTDEENSRCFDDGQSRPSARERTESNIDGGQRNARNRRHSSKILSPNDTAPRTASRTGRRAPAAAADRARDDDDGAGPDRCEHDDPPAVDSPTVVEPRNECTSGNGSNNNSCCSSAGEPLLLLDVASTLPADRCPLARPDEHPSPRRDPCLGRAKSAACCCNESHETPRRSGYETNSYDFLTTLTSDFSNSRSSVDYYYQPRGSADSYGPRDVDDNDDDTNAGGGGIPRQFDESRRQNVTNTSFQNSAIDDSRGCHVESVSMPSFVDFDTTSDNYCSNGSTTDDSVSPPPRSYYDADVKTVPADSSSCGTY